MIKQKRFVVGTQVLTSFTRAKLYMTIVQQPNPNIETDIFRIHLTAKEIPLLKSTNHASVQYFNYLLTLTQHSNLV